MAKRARHEFAVDRGPDAPELRLGHDAVHVDAAAKRTKLNETGSKNGNKATATLFDIPTNLRNPVPTNANRLWAPHPGHDQRDTDIKKGILSLLNNQTVDEASVRPVAASIVTAIHEIQRKQLGGRTPSELHEEHKKLIKRTIAAESQLAERDSELKNEQSKAAESERNLGYALIANEYLDDIAHSLDHDEDADCENLTKMLNSEKRLSFEYSVALMEVQLEAEIEHHIRTHVEDLLSVSETRLGRVQQEIAEFEQSIREKYDDFRKTFMAAMPSLPDAPALTLAPTLFGCMRSTISKLRNENMSLSKAAENSTIQSQLEQLQAKVGMLEAKHQQTEKQSAKTKADRTQTAAQVGLLQHHQRAESFQHSKDVVDHAEASATESNWSLQDLHSHEKSVRPLQNQAKKSKKRTDELLVPSKQSHAKNNGEHQLRENASANEPRSNLPPLGKFVKFVPWSPVSPPAGSLSARHSSRYTVPGSAGSVMANKSAFDKLPSSSSIRKRSSLSIATGDPHLDFTSKPSSFTTPPSIPPIQISSSPCQELDTLSSSSSNEPPVVLSYFDSNGEYQLAPLADLPEAVHRDAFDTLKAVQSTSSKSPSKYQCAATAKSHSDTFWTHTHQGQFACRACFRKGRACLFWQEQHAKYAVLPLPDAVRAEEASTTDASYYMFPGEKKFPNKWYHEIWSKEPARALSPRPRGDLMSDCYRLFVEVAGFCTKSRYFGRI